MTDGRVVLISIEFTPNFLFFYLVLFFICSLCLKIPEIKYIFNHDFFLCPSLWISLPTITQIEKVHSTKMYVSTMQRTLIRIYSFWFKKMQKIIFFFHDNLNKVYISNSLLY